MNKKLLLATAFGFSLLISSASFAGNTDIAAGAEVHFDSLKDGDVVSSPLQVKFAASNVAIDPAGDVKPNSGHYHLLIDTTLSPDEMNFAIAKDDQHLHFGKAQTEATVELKPGKHTLQIVLGDGAHELHKTPVMSKVITIEVK